MKTYKPRREQPESLLDYRGATTPAPTCSIYSSLLPCHIELLRVLSTCSMRMHTVQTHLPHMLQPAAQLLHNDLVNGVSHMQHVSIC